MPYEIAVACDVKLGEVIRQNPDVSRIDIDRQAIESVMTDLAPPSEPGVIQPLLVIASHHDSLQKESKKRSRTTAGRFIAKDKRYGRIPTISVGVAGNPQTMASFDTPVMGQIAQSYVHGDMTREELRDQLLATASPTNFESANEIQSTALHELSHYSDHLQPQRMSEIKRYQYKRLAGNMAVASLINVSASYGLGYSEAALDLPVPPYVLLAVNIGAIVLSFNRWGQRLLPNAHKSYLNNPGEKRARQVEESEHNYSRIINIVK